MLIRLLAAVNIGGLSVFLAFLKDEAFCSHTKTKIFCSRMIYSLSTFALRSVCEQVSQIEPLQTHTPTDKQTKYYNPRVRMRLGLIKHNLLKAMPTLIQYTKWYSYTITEVGILV